MTASSQLSVATDPNRDLTHEETRRELVDDLIGFCLEFDRPYRRREIEVSCRVSRAFGRTCVAHGESHEEYIEDNAYRLSDAIGELETEARRVIAIVAPALVDAADTVAPWAPKRIGMWEQLDGPERHRLAAQIFAKAGVSDRLLTLEERYPNVISDD